MAIFGVGAIGLLDGLSARLRGAADVFVLSRVARCSRAGRHGVGAASRVEGSGEDAVVAC